jgi:hypothetical protein
MKARIEVNDHSGEGWRQTVWGYELEGYPRKLGRFIDTELAKLKIKEVRKRFPRSSYRLVYERKPPRKGDSCYISAKQRADKFLRDVFPDEAGLVKAFREHARQAIERYKRRHCK